GAAHAAAGRRRGGVHPEADALHPAGHPHDPPHPAGCIRGALLHVLSFPARPAAPARRPGPPRPRPRPRPARRPDALIVATRPAGAAALLKHRAGPDRPVRPCPGSGGTIRAWTISRWAITSNGTLRP